MGRAGSAASDSARSARPLYCSVDVEQYQALIIPGGRAPEYIRIDPDVRRITEHFFARNLPIALVCHGAQVPAVYGLLQGRRTACFPPITGDMENAGATVIDAPDVVDGNLVSGRTYHDHGHYMGAWMKLLDEARAKAAGRREAEIHIEAAEGEQAAAPTAEGEQTPASAAVSSPEEEAMADFIRRYHELRTASHATNARG